MLFSDALGALFNKSRIIQETLIRGYAKSDFIYELEYKSLEYVSLKKKEKKESILCSSRLCLFKKCRYYKLKLLFSILIFFKML